MEEENKNNEPKKKQDFTILFVVGGVAFGIVLMVGLGNTITSCFVIGLVGLVLDILGYILYRFSPAKRKEAEEKAAREKQEAEEKAALEKTRRELENLKLQKIKKTNIIGTAVITDKDSAMARGVVGMALVGTAGAVIGTSTAKNIKTTTFLIEYTLDIPKEAKEVQDGSELYNIYIQYLEF